MRRMVLAVSCVVVAACGDNTIPDPSSCTGYTRPPKRASIGCADPSDPMTRVPCDTGSAISGTWSTDDDGLPAFDLAIDERCDDAPTAYSPSPRAIRDPLHVVGDGHGLVAMAHA